MTAEQRQNRIITGFVLLSLLLHLLLLLVPKDRLFPVEIAPPPVYVEVRPPQQLERELDLPIREELEKPREKPAERLAEKDQVVEQETAPEGQDTEDLERVVRAPEPVPQVPQVPPPSPPQPESQPEKPQVEDVEKPRPETVEGWQRPKAEPPAELPDLETLTQISPQAMASIERDWRRKYREDVARGDTVWMDTQQDLLISFMRRFRNNIYNVWNYPEEARRLNQRGSCLLRITVDRKGDVTDVILMESSGSRVLDDEAIRAVRKGATYGPLPRAYPNEYLHIMALFNYQMSGNSGYQRRRLY
jgi:periplasmic protein TonB